MAAGRVLVFASHLAAVASGLVVTSGGYLRDLHARSSPINCAAAESTVLDKALDCFDAAVANDANNATAYRELGRTAKRLRHLPMAASSLRRVVELVPDDVDGRLELGECLVMMGYVDDAEAAFNEVLQKSPQKASPLQERRAKIARANLVIDGRGQRSEAYAVLSSLAPSSPPMALLAGVAADSMGEHAAAREFYSDALRHDEFDEDAALHLMLSHARAGDHASAASLRPKISAHVLSSVDYLLSTPVAMAECSHYFTYDMLQLALAAADESSLDGGLLLEFGVRRAT